jgi:hypothetical protein
MSAGYQPDPVRAQHVVYSVIATALGYLLFVVVALAIHDWNPLWFAWLDDDYVPTAPADSIGYDGQFIYAIALEGLDASPRLDNPPYRMQRILLPALAGILARGQESAVPWAILAVNWVSLTVAAWVLSRWLAANGVSPWYSIMYTFYVGTLMAFSRDLTEPLAVTLATAGVVAWERDRVPVAIGLFALSTLAKETTVLFVAACALHALVQHSWKRVLWAVTCLVPLGLWQAYLTMRYGEIPLLAGPPQDAGWPLAGILGQLTLDPGRLSAFLTVAIPAVLLTLYAALRTAQDPTRLAMWLVLVHALVLLFLPTAVYDHIMHAGRNASGLVASLVLAVPLLCLRLRNLAVIWWVTPSLVWLVPILRWTPWP